MPFTIGGEWVPEPISNKPQRPIKIIKEKRGKSIVTIIRNLPLDTIQLKSLCSKLKQHLACGGAIKEETIELQGDKIKEAKLLLQEEGFRIS